jgi:hypothetical protein
MQMNADNTVTDLVRITKFSFENMRGANKAYCVEEKLLAELRLHLNGIYINKKAGSAPAFLVPSFEIRT